MLNLINARSILLACALGFAPSLLAQSISITIAPPPLPVYEQPPCPADGYYWTPGYWAYGDDGYFWVPGAWVEVPEPGFFWTPGYWDFGNGVYIWHGGYWCRHIGFYGGVNHGFGYYGSGFCGGRWDGRVFHYNTAVWRVNPSFVHNTYADPTVINKTVVNNRISFNGPGGINARPTAAEEGAEHEQHIEATDRQLARREEARHDPNQRYTVNHGQPGKAAETSRVEHREGEHHEAVHREAEHHETEHHEAVRHEATHHEGHITPPLITKNTILPSNTRKSTLAVVKRKRRVSAKPAYWRFGVLEYWRIGVLAAKTVHHSITPPLHYSTTPIRRYAHTPIRSYATTPHTP